MNSRVSALNVDLLDREKKFHDAWGESVDPSKVRVLESFEACTAPEGRKAAEWLGDVTGKSLLDLGCGCGEAAVYFALQGADVTATDLSLGMLATTKRVAQHHGVEVKTVQGSGDVLPFEDNSFDVVYAANVLHHVALEPTLSEVKRILRPGGVFVSWDPLRHNPIVNIYRWMASKVRTVDEMPLSIRDLKTFEKYFDNVKYDTFWLTTLWIFIRLFVIERISPNKERYWKKIIDEHARFSNEYRPLAKIDTWLLSKIPLLRRYCWNILVMGFKK